MKNKPKRSLWLGIWLFLGILVVASLLFPTSNQTKPTSIPSSEFVAITKSTPTPIPTEIPSPMPSVTPEDVPASTDEEVITPVETSAPTMKETVTPIPTVSPTPLSTESPLKVCSVSVHCQNALTSDSGLNQSIREVLPQDGVILQAQNVNYEEGETAFDVLSRELRNRNILFEYNENPMFNSAYIEGINHLYEFDCGAQSGWLYFVNGKSPGSGCSQYVVQPGDYIEFIYTCNFGNDIF